MFSGLGRGLSFIQCIFSLRWGGEWVVVVVKIRELQGWWVFKWLWIVFPAVSMEAIKRERVRQGEGYRVSHVFFHVYTKKTLADSLFSTICIPTDQINLSWPMSSWEWDPGTRCQLEISVASLHQFRHPIFVYLPFISASKSIFNLIFVKAPYSLLWPKATTQQVCKGGHLCLKSLDLYGGTAWAGAEDYKLCLFTCITPCTCSGFSGSCHRKVLMNKEKYSRK